MVRCIIAPDYPGANLNEIYLAMEEREEDVANKARNLIECFHGCFCRITYSIHPQGIPGEVPGKSSNQSWAVRQASDFYNDYQKKDIIVTVMDGIILSESLIEQRLIQMQLTPIYSLNTLMKLLDSMRRTLNLDIEQSTCHLWYSIGISTTYRSLYEWPTFSGRARASRACTLGQMCAFRPQYTPCRWFWLTTWVAGM